MYILRHEQDLSERLHKELAMAFLSRKGISVAGGTDKCWGGVSSFGGEEPFETF